MDGHGFDRFARSLAAPGSRRRLLAAWCGATLTAVAAAVGFAKRPTDAQTCAAEDEPCTLLSNPCCAGLVCATLPLNVNSGVCVPGELRTVPESDPGDGRNPRPTNTPEETQTPKPTKTPSPDRTPKPTKTPESDKRVSLRLQLRCQGTDEALEIENTGDTAVMIEQIESLAVPAGTGKHSFNVDRVLPAGGSVTFTSGRDAEKTDNRLTGEELYRDEDNANAVEVTTSGGTFRAACSKRRNNGNGGGPQTSLKITAVCGEHQDAEATTIKNTGSKKVVIKSINDNPIDPTYSQIPSGKTKYYYSGPQGRREPNSAQTFATNDIYGTAADRKTAVVKTSDGKKFDAICTEYSND